MNAVDPSGKLERALRLADIGLNSAAVPLPVDVTPSTTTQDQIAPNDHVTVAPVDNASAQDAPPNTEQAHAGHVDPFVPDEAVVRSLQAAIDAVHDSLHTTTPDAVPDVSPVPAEAPSPVSASQPQALPVAAADAAFVDVAPVTAAAAPQLIEAAPDTSPDIAAPLTSVLSTADALLTDVGSIVHALGDTVDGAVHALTSTVGDLLSGDLQGGSAAGHTAAPDAVTIPSMEGRGTDAMAGILPAPPLSDASDPALTSLHEMPIFDAIGAPEVIHGDQDLAHTAHAPQHLVGSGLI